jgi:hypothetical protein
MQRLVAVARHLHLQERAVGAFQLEAHDRPRRRRVAQRGPQATPSVGGALDLKVEGLALRDAERVLPTAKARARYRALELLAENIRQQKAWARDFKRLWVGVAASQLYTAERDPLVRMRALLRESGSLAEVRAAFDTVATPLAAAAPDLHSAIASYLNEPKQPEALAARLDAFLARPPPAYYPPERLMRTLERVRAEGVEGVVIFSAGGLTSAGLWPTAAEFFGR